MNKILLAPTGSVFLPEEYDQNANEMLGLILVRAMIAAAGANGRLKAQQVEDKNMYLPNNTFYQFPAVLNQTK